MERVKSGLEFRTRGKKTLWNKSGTITAAYKSLLSHFADHLMQPRGKLGHVHKGLAAQAKTNGYMWFMHPQVTDNNHNIHCMGCHMQAAEGFSQHDFQNSNNPYLSVHDKEKHTWYTRVNLGRDNNDKIVWESAHVILAAARWGVPEPAQGIKPDPRQSATHCMHCMAPAAQGSREAASTPSTLCGALKSKTGRIKKSRGAERTRVPWHGAGHLSMHWCLTKGTTPSLHDLHLDSPKPYPRLRV